MWIHRREYLGHNARYLLMIKDAIVTLVSRIPLILAEALVLILTWIKTYKQVVDARGTEVTMSLSECLLRDGEYTTLSSLEIAPHSPILQRYPIFYVRFLFDWRSRGLLTQYLP